MRLRFLLLTAALLLPTVSIAAEPAARGGATGAIGPHEVGELIRLPLATVGNCPKAFETISLRVAGLDTGLRGLGCEHGRITMRLRRPAESLETPPAVAAAWQLLLGNPWETRKSDYVRAVPYTLVDTAPDALVNVLGQGQLQIRVLAGARPGIGIAMVLGVWLALVLLGLKSGLLRDANGSERLSERPYSLARTQLAWWFGIVAGAYVFAWVLTGDIPTVSGQALALLGIAGAAGLTAASLDINKHPAPVRSSGSFFLDLLSDKDGVTVYRLQMLAMTVIIGVMFVFHVVTRLSMPELDETTLTLLGISAGTYVGFKVPEKQVEPPSAEAGAAEADPKSAYQET